MIIVNEHDEIRKEVLEREKEVGETDYCCDICKKPIYYGEKYYIEEASISTLLGGPNGPEEEKLDAWDTLIFCMGCFEATRERNPVVNGYGRPVDPRHVPGSVEGEGDEDSLE